MKKLKTLKIKGKIKKVTKTKPYMRVTEGDLRRSKQLGLVRPEDAPECEINGRDEDNSTLINELEELDNELQEENE